MRRSLFIVTLAVGLAAAAVAPVAARRGRVVTHAAETRTPTFASFRPDEAIARPPVAAALAHLASHQDRYRISAPTRSLRSVEVLRNAGRIDVRFQQLHEGVPVWGGQYLVHMRRSANGLVAEAANGHVFSELSVPVDPELDASAARRLALMRLRGLDDVRLLPHGLTVLPREQGVLTYHFSASGSVFGRPVAQEVFVDAHTGGLAFTFNNLQHQGPVAATGETAHGEQVTFGAYDTGTVVEMRDQSKPMFATSGGEITTHNVKRSGEYRATPDNIVKSTSPVFQGAATSSGAVDAHYGASLTYDFFQSLGRDSLDGAGMDIVSSVNASERDGSPMYNAFWDGINEQMVYGNPDPREYYPFSAELDVVGHELTHGVTQHSGNLAYIAQSGAMNEAYSDYFGNAIDVIESGTSMSDPEAGQIGESLCKTSQPSIFACPLRDLNDGATTEDYIYFLVDLDNGGVHLNSTIYGGALWDVREALGADADRYIYRALTAYTTPLDDFLDGRNAVITAAEDLGASSQQVDAIEAAFDAHGIVDGWDTPPSNDATVLMSNVASVSDLGFSKPQLSGNRFVIADYEDKTQLCCVGLQIFGGTLDGSEPIQRLSVPDPSSNITDETPDISGNRVVWSRIRIAEGSVRGAQIVVRELGGPEEIIARAGMTTNPSIDGRFVAWEGGRSNSNIIGRRLGARTKVIAGGRGDQVLPQVAGSRVAWWDLKGRPVVGLKDLRTGKTKIVRPSDRFDFAGPPTLTDRYMFWFEQNIFEDRGSIVRMDLRTGRRRVVVRSSSDDAPVWVLALTTPPLVSANDNYFVYSSEMEYAREFGAIGRPGSVPNDQVGRDIFIVPIRGGSPVPVTENRADQAFPLIGEDRRVIWLDSTTSLTDLVSRVVP